MEVDTWLPVPLSTRKMYNPAVRILAAIQDLTFCQAAIGHVTPVEMKLKNDMDKIIRLKAGGMEQAFHLAILPTKNAFD